MEDFTRDVKLQIHYRKEILSVYDEASDEEILRFENVPDKSWCNFHKLIMSFNPSNSK